MTYTLEGNDPTRRTQHLSPAEVKAALLGGDEETEGLLARSYGRGRLLSDVLDEDAQLREGEEERDVKIIELAPAFSREQIARVKAQSGQRCPTCGRARDCCCPACSYCDQTGRPKQLRRSLA